MIDDAKLVKVPQMDNQEDEWQKAPYIAVVVCHHNGAEGQDDGYDTYGTINDQRGTFSDNGDESGLAYTGVCVAVAKVIDQKQTVCYKSLGNSQKPYGHGDVEDGDMGDYIRALNPNRVLPKNKKGLKRLFNVEI